MAIYAISDLHLPAGDDKPMDVFGEHWEKHFERIRGLIDAERAAEGVLSDDRIVEILKEAGVDIARRTVAKYREAMRIPSSVERRRILREAS